MQVASSGFYQNLFIAENDCLLCNSKVKRCKTKTRCWTILQCFIELEGTAKLSDNSFCLLLANVVIRLCKDIGDSSAGLTSPTSLCLCLKIMFCGYIFLIVIIMYKELRAVWRHKTMVHLEACNPPYHCNMHLFGLGHLLTSVWKYTVE